MCKYPLLQGRVAVGHVYFADTFGLKNTVPEAFYNKQTLDYGVHVTSTSKVLQAKDFFIFLYQALHLSIVVINQFQLMILLLGRHVVMCGYVRVWCMIGQFEK